VEVNADSTINAGSTVNADSAGNAGIGKGQIDATGRIADSGYKQSVGDLEC
jgi:hypothetical protein